MSPADFIREPLRLGTGRPAVLFIPGFTSSPQCVLPVAERIAQAGYTVHLPLLPGHATTPEDLKRTRAADWLRAVEGAWDALAAEHPRPAVTGLSLGAALALHVAAVRPVSSVIALAPFLYLRDPRLFLLPLLKLLMPWQKGIGNDIKTGPLTEAFYPRFATRNVDDLLAVTRTVRSELAAVRAPLLGIQAAEDHIVPASCLEDLMRWAGSAVKEKVRLEDSYHVITLDHQHPRVAELMIEFLQRHTA